MVYYFTSNNECISVLDEVVLLLVVGKVFDSHRVVALGVHHFKKIVSEDREVVLLLLHLSVILRLQAA